MHAKRIYCGEWYSILTRKNPGKITAKDAPNDFETDWRMFLYCLELFRYFNKSEPRKSQIIKIKGGK